jgi:hypothetical protein
VALGVSIYSAEQARRAALANERVAAIAEEQTRPRVQISALTAILYDAEFTIKVVLKNVGNAPATVTAFTIDTLGSDSRGKYNLAQANNSVLYPNDSRQFVLTKPRVVRRAMSKEIDYGTLSPGTFGFSVSYDLLGKTTLQFSETVQFSELTWVNLTRAVQRRPRASNR